MADAAAVTQKVAANSPDSDTVLGQALNIDQLEVHTGTGGAGVVGIKGGKVIIADSGAALLTLVAPTAGAISAGGDDGKVLIIESTTAQAHTVTTPANKINGSKLTATFAAVADHIELIAYQGVWYVLNNSTTLS
jgi:hypothetical protein